MAAAILSSDLQNSVPSTPDSAASSITLNHSLYDLGLTSVHVEQIEKFQSDLELCENDDNKYQACVRMRDQQLAQRAVEEVFVASLESIMESHCEKYRKRKSQQTRSEQWNHWVGVATSGSKTISNCLAPLKSVCRCWGRDKIQHYGWANSGQKYCKTLCAAANVVYNWDEAVIKLNRLMLRRVELTGRRPIRNSVNPIDQVDLMNLKQWTHKESFVKDNDPDSVSIPYKPLSIDDLPEGFGFDMFGLVVRSEYARHMGSDPSLSATDEGGTSLSDTLNANIDRVIDSIDSVPPLSPPPIDMSSAHDSIPDTSAQPIQQSSSDDGEEIDTESVLSNNDESDQGHESQIELMKRKLRSRSPKQPYPKSTSAQKRGRNKMRGNKGASSDRNSQCCRPEISLSFKSMLDNPSDTGVLALRTALAEHAPQQQKLCLSHLQRYAHLTSELAFNKATLNSLLSPHDITDNHNTSSTSKRKRRSSLSDIYRTDWPTAKRHQTIVTDRVEIEPYSQLAPAVQHDEDYRQQVLSEVLANDVTEELLSHGKEVNGVVAELLGEIQPPRLHPDSEQNEIRFCSSREAATAIDSSLSDTPIVAQQQQQFRWNHESPIVEFLERMDDLDRKVPVHIPTRSIDSEPFELLTNADIQHQFVGNKSSDEPWGVFGIPSPLPSCILPSFLTSDNCQLLSRVRDLSLASDTALTETWNTWKDVMECAYLLQGGHHTKPSRYRNGFETWITAQEGRLGLGWLSRPSQEGIEAWQTDSCQFAKGNWRYIVLKPGQTVFLPCGTTHFFFTLKNEQVLALGGHILRWSSVARWIESMISLAKDVTTTSPLKGWKDKGHVQRVAKLVEDRWRRGKGESVGGKEGVNQISALVKDFEAMLSH